MGRKGDRRKETTVCAACGWKEECGGRVREKGPLCLLFRALEEGEGDSEIPPDVRRELGLGEEELLRLEERLKGEREAEREEKVEEGLLPFRILEDPGLPERTKYQALFGLLLPNLTVWLPWEVEGIFLSGEPPSPAVRGFVLGLVLSSPSGPRPWMFLPILIDAVLEGC